MNTQDIESVAAGTYYTKDFALNIPRLAPRGNYQVIVKIEGSVSGGPIQVIGCGNAAFSL